MPDDTERQFRSGEEFRESMFPRDVERERLAAETPKEAGERTAREALARSRKASR